jgi:hypothetical protein
LSSFQWFDFVDLVVSCVVVADAENFAGLTGVIDGADVVAAGLTGFLSCC